MLTLLFGLIFAHSNVHGSLLGNIGIERSISSNQNFNLCREWEKQGETLIGNKPFEFFGTSVATSRDGLTVAVGAPQDDEVNKDDAQNEQRGDNSKK